MRAIDWSPNEDFLTQGGLEESLVNLGDDRTGCELRVLRWGEGVIALSGLPGSQ